MYFSTHTVKKLSAILLLSVVGFFAVHISARAHTTDSFWEVATGKYFADVGYDPAVFMAGQHSRFDFGLFKDRADTESVDFAEVWVRIKKEKETLLATGIRK